MDVGQIDTNKYTHIHFAFADVTKDFNVDISAVKEQFDLFKGMSGVKKIISFGGWDFSTMPGTFNILREAVKPANRDIFQKNLVAFVNEHNLDGIDLDWEYPGVSSTRSLILLLHYGLG
jgi:GH18 family chitinase